MYFYEILVLLTIIVSILSTFWILKQWIDVFLATTDVA